MPTTLSAARRRSRGFTMIEVMIASALLGFSLVVMFGFHSQALRSNKNARRLTECTYLAQTHLERIVAMDWTEVGGARDVSDGGSEADAVGMYDDLEWGLGHEVNALGSAVDAELTPAMYTVTWDVTSMDPPDDTWIRVRVRCTFPDDAFSTRHGTTVSSFRYRDS
jgi:prepilin-type N-terminal cleavage/methylation domain-containing protein